MKKVKKFFKVKLVKIFTKFSKVFIGIKNELGIRGENFHLARFFINLIIYFCAFYYFGTIIIENVNKFTKAGPNIVFAYNFYADVRQYTSEPPPEKWLFIYDYLTHLGTSHEIVIINDGNKIAKNILIEIKADEPITTLFFIEPYSYNDYEIKKGFNPKSFLGQTVIEIEDLNELAKSVSEKFRKSTFNNLYEQNKYININIPELYPISSKKEPNRIYIRFRYLYERIVFIRPKIKISMLHKNKEIIAKESKKYRKKLFRTEEIIIGDTDISTSYLIQNESDFDYKTWKESNMEKFRYYFRYPEDNPYYIHLIPKNYKWPPPDLSKATLSLRSIEMAINEETMKEGFPIKVFPLIYEKYELNNIESIIQYEVDLSMLVVENNKLFLDDKYNKIIGYSFENDGIFHHEYSIIDTDGDGLFDIRYPKYFLEFPDWCFYIGRPKYNVNINESSELELGVYLNIDTPLVKKIIKNRPYKKVEDLLKKKILTKEQFKKIEKGAVLKIID